MEPCAQRACGLGVPRCIQVRCVNLVPEDSRGLGSHAEDGVTSVVARASVFDGASPGEVWTYQFPGFRDWSASGLPSAGVSSRLPGFRGWCVTYLVHHLASALPRILEKHGVPLWYLKTQSRAFCVCVYSPFWMGMDRHAAGAKLASTAKTISCGNSMWQTISCVNFTREKRTHNPSMCSEKGSMCSVLGLCVRFST